MEFPEFQIDWERERRTGVPEAIFCHGKTPAQIDAIAAAAGDRRLLLTRLSPTLHAALAPETRALLDHDPLSATALLGGGVPLAASGIGIVAAGTSDLAVAREAARTLAFAGYDAEIFADVGVAGLWRLMARLDEFRRCRVLIAVAGMEGALFSVLAGLVEAPVIAVPTSVGYGVAAGGTAALHAALASCAPGVVVVNIDNGFGAAAAALKMLRAYSRAM
ncbi:1-(5-phosphoribosyl)-5-amino-4-imidazole-carboxylate carboxylase [Aliidongia dinghuensis]|uniref:1-(5-phosphoribosyl)-5-amino-4-imidazole-carboxylate carboxylase n=1 Tax=Aliidongia dinghuensis TaxID=1867774 RepID=A0A8J2YY75_9PROT|nr:nickel pincer cofactor biosynthesis protein LarB [Aliidongia dinghuensis]GGF39685.1 1-(5-phosphoribosyl)-5-amino-4-imidazole-carboxylate carboxylase [Aliidongia dinghuensis]